MGMGVSKADQELIDEFVEAAKLNDLTTIKRLMPQLNGKTESGDTALHMAATKGNLDVVLEILNQGSALECDAKDSDDATPLMLAAGQGHFEIVHKICRSGANPNLLDRLGWSPLHHAAAGGHSLVVSYLMNKCKRSLIFSRDSSGCTPLWLGASKGDPETVRLLLLEGAYPNDINDEDVSVYDAAKEAEYDESDNNSLDIILDMLDVAAERWAELKNKDENCTGADPIDARPAKVLDGTIDGPSLPVGEEGQPLVNEDATDKLVDDATLEQMRKKVGEALRLEDVFIETYVHGQERGMVNVEI